jgi:hypothetical protein
MGRMSKGKIGRIRQTGLGIGGEMEFQDDAILTPTELLARLDAEFHFDFDPCPYPRPEGFDGLKVDWGKSNWCNPIFWKRGRGKEPGPTAWARKAIGEAAKGNLTVLAFPQNQWEALLLAHIGTPDLRVFFKGEWWWLRPDGTRFELSHPLVLWIIRPKTPRGGA